MQGPPLHGALAPFNMCKLLLISYCVDPSRTSTFGKEEALLNDLMERKSPQCSVEDTLNDVKGELAVLYAVCGVDAPWMTSSGFVAIFNQLKAHI